MLNHSFHESGDPNGNGLSTRRYHKNDSGEIDSESLNYFKRGTTLYNRAESESLSIGELTDYSHGNRGGFAAHYDFNKGNFLTEILVQDSVMFRNLVSGHSKSLTMVLKSCETGSYRMNNQNISQILTENNTGLTIYGAASYWRSDGSVYFTYKGERYYPGYNKYYGGELVGNVPKK